MRKEGQTEGAVTTTGMSAVIGAVDTIVELMGKVWELMTSNPLLTLFVAASLLPIGIALFTSLRNAARG